MERAVGLPWQELRLSILAISALLLDAGSALPRIVFVMYRNSPLRRFRTPESCLLVLLSVNLTRQERWDGRFRDGNAILHIVGPVVPDLVSLFDAVQGDRHEDLFGQLDL